MLRIIFMIIAAMLLPGCAGSGGRATASAAGSDTSAVAEAAAPVFDADSAYAHVASQLAFGPRVPGSEAHSRCADFIVSRLKASGADTVIMTTPTVTDHTGRSYRIKNILARFNSSAQGAPVLLVAHWDTRPWADAEADESLHNTPIPGANDGASGVAVLLEIARIAGSKVPDVPVDLLFVDAEDSGQSNSDDESSWCLGTQEWVKTMPYDLSQRPRFGILLDMVGGTGARFHREPISEYYAPAVVGKVWAAAARAGYGDIFVNKEGSAVVDDHLFLNRAGIPTIDIIEAVNERTGTFPATWHTLSDDLPAISKESLKAAGQTVTNVIYSEK